MTPGARARPGRAAAVLQAARIVLVLLVALAAACGADASAQRSGEASTAEQLAAEAERNGADAAAPSAAAASTTAAARPSSTVRPAPTTQPAAARDESGLLMVAAAKLPPEARRTLALIEASGPFPYERDGIVFNNREAILPKRVRGYYHEYTVPTPGERDRGARRIVTGEAGERYYTADHYESFVRVAP
ncbi:MAG: ribonuclease domain-containing protein [Acidimicrobiales bacterium]